MRRCCHQLPQLFQAAVAILSVVDGFVIQPVDTRRKNCVTSGCTLSVAGASEQDTPHFNSPLGPTDLIGSLCECRSTQEVRQILLDHPNLIPQEGLPPEGTRGATIAVAAFRRLVEIDARGSTTQQLLPRLMRESNQAVTWDLANSTNVPILDVFSRADLLVALSCHPQGHENEDVVALAGKVCVLLERQLEAVIWRLRPSRHVRILQAITKMELAHDDLLEAICCHLKKSHVIKRLDSRSLATGLSALTWKEIRSPETIRVLLKRFRKEKIRSTASQPQIRRALAAASAIVGEESLRKEAESLVITILARDFQLGAWNITSLGPIDVRVALKAVATYFPSDDRTYHVTKALCKTIESSEMAFRIWDVSDVLDCMIALDLHDEIGAIKAIGERFKNLCENRQTVKPFAAIGKILRSVWVLSEGSNDKINFLPFANGVETLLHEEEFLRRCYDNMLSRCVRFLWKMGLPVGEEALALVARRYCDLAVEAQMQGTGLGTYGICCVIRLLTTHKDFDSKGVGYASNAALTILGGSGRESFLASCTFRELSDLLWLAARLEWEDEDVIVALAGHILLKSRIEECWPSYAARILGSLATIDKKVGSAKLHSKLPGIFDSIGVHLLTNKLSMDEITLAMYAYARVMYINDMGVFDHLAHRLKVGLLESCCSTKLISRGLWACARMSVWENDEEHTAPYLSCVPHYFHALTERCSELSKESITQTIWSVGRLGIDEEQGVGHLALRAVALADQLNSQEVSNILWGLSQVDYRNKNVTLTLAKRMTDPGLQTNANGVASVLYAITNMRVRDSELFSKLTDIFMSQLDSASAQAVANALWAFKTAYYKPPQELVDQWASSKLDLTNLDLSLLED